jgi:hypothetical protein
MQSIRVFAIVTSVFMLGSIMLGLSVTPNLKLSYIDTAHAARPGGHRGGHHGRHRSAHRSARGGRRNVNVDIDVHRRPHVGAVAAAIAIGTRVATLPHGCRTITPYGVTYYHCGSVYYRPYYQGTTVVYVVSDAP